MQVAVVDDEPLLLRVATRMLEAAGFSVVAHQDPCAAQAALRKAPPDVILTDQQMPRLNGADLARSLRQYLGVKCPFIIVWTGCSSSLSELDEAAVDAVLYKPVRTEELVRM